MAETPSGQEVVFKLVARRDGARVVIRTTERPFDVGPGTTVDVAVREVSDAGPAEAPEPDAGPDDD